MNHRKREATSNDPKLSDRRRRRGSCVAGGEGGGQEAATVTPEPVRCSAWLGDVGIDEADKIKLAKLCSELAPGELVDSREKLGKTIARGFGESLRVTKVEPTHE